MRSGWTIDRSAMKSILLVEPEYHNKFPPLGLMKLATFFQGRGDYVRFVKGKSSAIRAVGWDAVYITTLFTFEWKRTVETIRFYKRTPGDPPVIVGGILATLMPEQLERETGARVVPGLLDRAGKLGIANDETIDRLVPDYSILEDVDYRYPVSDAYFVHSTRGCVNACDFCAVPKIEPEYRSFLSLESQVEAIRAGHGEKRDLILMDNNTVASERFDDIIDEILALGFSSGARLKGRRRHVDFNQGLDARLLTERKMQRLAETSVWPLRIAFDDIAMKDTYEQAIRWAAASGLERLSNYVLFNFKDTPADFYQRLRINVELNEELGTHIYSFPMRFSPVDRQDRAYVGPHWTWRYIRGVQCILNATRGVVGVRKKFFLRAFGGDPDSFVRLISMPEHYIMERDRYEEEEAREWCAGYGTLGHEELDDFRTRALHSRGPQLGSRFPAVEELLTQY
jgi:hypothetical protein